MWIDFIDESWYSALSKSFCQQGGYFLNKPDINYCAGRIFIFIRSAVIAKNSMYWVGHEKAQFPCVCHSSTLTYFVASFPRMRVPS
jgi:hypothetical protein